MLFENQIVYFFKAPSIVRLVFLSVYLNGASLSARTQIPLWGASCNIQMHYKVMIFVLALRCSELQKPTSVLAMGLECRKI